MLNITEKKSNFLHIKKKPYSDHKSFPSNLLNKYEYVNLKFF